MRSKADETFVIVEKIFCRTIPKYALRKSAFQSSDWSSDFVQLERLANRTSLRSNIARFDSLGCVLAETAVTSMIGVVTDATTDFALRFTTYELHLPLLQVG